MSILWQLFSRFLALSLVAFGGGQAALPLVERLSVAETGWLTPAAFAAAVAFGYVTPGPVLITAAFVGYVVAGLPGAAAATVGAFLLPTLLAAGTAAGLQQLAQNRWLRAFGRGAAPAVVGLLGATAWSLGRGAVSAWPLALITLAALVLAARTALNPVWLVLGGAVAGWLLLR